MIEEVAAFSVSQEPLYNVTKHVICFYIVWYTTQKSPEVCVVLFSH